VYSEEEYLNGAGLESTNAEEWPVQAEPAMEPARRYVRERRLHRFAGAAMLVGAIGIVAGVVVANSSRRGAERRPASLVADARSPEVARSLTVAEPSTVASGPGVGRPSEITRSRVTQLRQGAKGLPSHLPTNASRRPSIRPAAGRRGGSNTHSSKRAWGSGRPDTQPTEGGIQHGGGVAVVVDDSPNTVGANTVETQAGISPAASSSAGSSMARAEAGHHVEFGFER
jgi:hypothetical protein